MASSRASSTGPGDEGVSLPVRYITKKVKPDWADSSSSNSANSSEDNYSDSDIHSAQNKSVDNEENENHSEDEGMEPFPAFSNDNIEEQALDAYFLDTVHENGGTSPSALRSPYYSGVVSPYYSTVVSTAVSTGFATPLGEQQYSAMAIVLPMTSCVCKIAPQQTQERKQQRPGTSDVMSTADVEAVMVASTLQNIMLLNPGHSFTYVSPSRIEIVAEPTVFVHDAETGEDFEMFQFSLAARASRDRRYEEDAEPAADKNTTDNSADEKEEAKDVGKEEEKGEEVEEDLDDSDPDFGPEYTKLVQGESLNRMSAALASLEEIVRALRGLDCNKYHCDLLNTYGKQKRESRVMITRRMHAMPAMPVSVDTLGLEGFQLICSGCRCVKV